MSTTALESVLERKYIYVCVKYIIGLLCIYFCFPVNAIDVYDGFIFPTERLFSKIANYFVTTGISTKDASEYAMLMHLTTKVEISKDSMTFGSELSAYYENACNIYFHLKQKECMFHQDQSKCITHMNPDYLDKGLQKVSLQVSRKMIINN